MSLIETALIRRCSKPTWLTTDRPKTTSNKHPRLRPKSISSSISIYVLSLPDPTSEFNIYHHLLPFCSSSIWYHLNIMGNAVSPCFKQSSKSSVKLVFWEGTTRILTGKHLAGEIMFEFPDRMVCHADSFFIGRVVPALAIDDELIPAQTYFVLPIDLFACNVLSASSLSAFTWSPKPSPIKFSECPFEYIKGSNGRVMIKVMPEFITKLITTGKEDGCSSPNNSFLCSTPELQKHYEQLVGSKGQVWSPKLETISEYKLRYSPCRFIGLEWREKEEKA